MQMSIKKLIFIVLFLVIPSLVQPDVVIIVQPTSAGDTYDDITFFLSLEACDPESFCTTYTFDSSDYTEGEDEIMTRTNNASVNLSGAMIGSYGIDISEANEHFSLTDSTDAALPTDSFRIGFWLHRTGTQTDNGMIFNKAYSSDETFYIRWQNSTDLRVSFGNSGVYTFIQTSATIIPDETDVFVEVSYDAGVDEMELFISGVSKGTDDTANTPMAATGTGYTTIGSLASTTTDFWMDNIIISSDYQRDLYDGGTGLCSLATSPK
jgi:hypothetical protein